MAPAEKATDPHADIAQDLNTLAENLCGNQTVRARESALARVPPQGTWSRLGVCTWAVLQGSMPRPFPSHIVPRKATLLPVPFGADGPQWADSADGQATTRPHTWRGGVLRVETGRGKRDQGELRACIAIGVRGVLRGRRTPAAPAAHGSDGSTAAGCGCGAMGFTAARHSTKAFVHPVAAAAAAGHGRVHTARVRGLSSIPRQQRRLARTHHLARLRRQGPSLRPAPHSCAPPPPARLGPVGWLRSARALAAPHHHSNRPPSPEGDFACQWAGHCSLVHLNHTRSVSHWDTARGGERRTS